MDLNRDTSFQPQNLLTGIDRLARIKKEDQRLRAAIARLEDQVTLQNALLEKTKFELNKVRDELENYKTNFKKLVAEATQKKDEAYNELDKALNEEIQKRMQAEEQHAKLIRFVSGQLRENAEITQTQEELQHLREKHEALVSQALELESSLKTEKSRRMNFEAETARLRFLLSETQDTLDQ